MSAGGNISSSGDSLGALGLTNCAAGAGTISNAQSNVALRPSFVRLFGSRICRRKVYVRLLISTKNDHKSSYNRLSNTNYVIFSQLTVIFSQLTVISQDEFTRTSRGAIRPSKRTSMD